MIDDGGGGGDGGGGDGDGDGDGDRRHGLEEWCEPSSKNKICQ